SRIEEAGKLVEVPGREPAALDRMGRAHDRPRDGLACAGLELVLERLEVLRRGKLPAVVADHGERHPQVVGDAIEVEIVDGDRCVRLALDLRGEEGAEAQIVDAPFETAFGLLRERLWSILQ